MKLIDEMRRLRREDRLGHAYVCRGNPQAEGKTFATELAAMLLAGEDPERETVQLRRVASRQHPDVWWVEPRGALRQMRVDDVDEVLRRIHEKSFEGGWKLAVFLGADRLNPSSGNKLLKSLEEPPPQTLLLLVTADPGQLLATLRSRCQLLELESETIAEPDWLPPLLDLLRKGPPRNLREKLLRAGQFRDFFIEWAKCEEEGEAEIETESVDDDVVRARESLARRKIQAEVMLRIESWYRDLLVCQEGAPSETLVFPGEAEALRAQAARLPPHAVLKLLENVRRATHRMDNNLPLQVLLENSPF